MRKFLVSALIATTALVPTQAFAQADELARLREQVAAMQAEVERLSTRLEEMEQRPAPTPAIVAAVAPTTPTPAPATVPQITFRGAPEITAPGGWSFKPRGRVQIDAGTVSSPHGIADANTGFGSELRRVYLGVEGKMPGGIGYRAEADVANSSVEITDLYLTYQASPALTLMVGQTKPFWGLEEVTSDLFTSFTERAAINTAFGYERRLGANAVLTRGPVIVQAGLFTDNVGDLNSATNNSLSFDGRVVVAPKIGDSQLHLAGSIHLRELNDSGTTVRYRVRPLIHTPDVRFIDTGSITSSSEDGYGIEAAWISGPFHATGEYHWQTVTTPGAALDPTFSGGYLEAGMFLTSGDSRGYRGGVFDRTRPENELGNGGIGAVQVNLRYDVLDLTDSGYNGGTQNGYLASLVWIPTAYTKLMINYGRLDYFGAARAALAGNRNYSVDSFGVRAQIDF